MHSQSQPYRQIMNEILNQLIPANVVKNIPAAGDAGVADFILGRAAEDSSLSDALDQLLSNAVQMDTEVNPEMVKILEANNAENFARLLTVTYMGYYSRPDIRSLVGVGSWAVHPKGYEVPLEPANIIEKLTEPVRERGVMYRDPADKPQVSS